MKKPYSFLLASALSGLFWGCSPKVGSALTANQLSAALPDGTSYAVLHLYRPSRVMGFAIGYDVRLNDSVVYRASNGSQSVLRRTRPGTILLSAKTEAREELTLTLEPGREYYVRCTLGAGVVVGRPVLKQVSVAEGSPAVTRLQKAVTATPGK